MNSQSPTECFEDLKIGLEDYTRFMGKLGPSRSERCNTMKFLTLANEVGIGDYSEW